MSSEEPFKPTSVGMRIAISGKSGCGNTTVSRMVAARLGLIQVNYTFKDLARDKGMTFEDVCRLAESDSQYDLTIDRMQVELAEQGGCVLGSRLAIWLLRRTAITIYLFAPLEVRAGRIAKREGWTLEQAMRHTEARDKRDHDRYQRLYDYDVDKYDFAELILEAGGLTPEQEVQAIVEHVSRTAGLL
jgi:CMP/dCMP kinase